MTLDELKLTEVEQYNIIHHHQPLSKETLGLLKNHKDFRVTALCYKYETLKKYLDEGVCCIKAEQPSPEDKIIVFKMVKGIATKSTVYDKASFEAWLRIAPKDPITNEPMSNNPSDEMRYVQHPYYLDSTRPSIGFSQELNQIAAQINTLITKPQNNEICTFEDEPHPYQRRHSF